jgi:hypothetical protein
MQKSVSEMATTRKEEIAKEKHFGGKEAPGVLEFGYDVTVAAHFHVKISLQFA